MPPGMHRVIINKCPKVNKSLAYMNARENFFNDFKYSLKWVILVVYFSFCLA